MAGLIGKKIGMTTIFSPDGIKISVTAIEVGPCKVIEIRTKEKNGYEAIQLGFGEKKRKASTKPVATYFEKKGTAIASVLREFKFNNISDFKMGDELKADFFTEGELIKVSGVSKGKGFQGVVKRHNFSGVGSATHGQSDRVRAPGSIGASSSPSRVFKGQKMAGRMGGDNVTVRNLKVVKVLVDKNIVLVKGAVPGHRNSILELHKK